MEKHRMNIGDRVWVFQPNISSRGNTIHATWKETEVVSISCDAIRVSNGVIEWVDADGDFIMLDLFIEEYGFMITKKKPDFSKEGIMKVQEMWNNYNE